MRCHMLTLLCLCCVLCLSVFLAGCAPSHPRSAPDSALVAAGEQCAAEASGMSDPPHNTMNKSWDAYYTMCMSKFGYGRTEMRQLWH